MYTWTLKQNVMWHYISQRGGDNKYDTVTQAVSRIICVFKTLAVSRAEWVN